MDGFVNPWAESSSQRAWVRDGFINAERSSQRAWVRDGFINAERSSQRAWVRDGFINAERSSQRRAWVRVGAIERASEREREKNIIWNDNH
jgi:hypothetical protein